jgi:hypothetical protein
MKLTENATPQPGKTYAINKKGSDTVISLVDGTKVAMRYWEDLASQKWECVEKDGWLGFVNRASTIYDRGAHLGHNGHDSLQCEAPHHRDWEDFQVVLHDEGFALEIRKDNRLAFIGITGGGTGLKLSTKGTTWWGFTVIDGGRPSDAPSTRSLSVDAPQMKLVLHW